MTEKIFIGIDDNKIEAKGEQLEYVLQAQADGQAEMERITATELAKKAAKESMVNKLEALGFTPDEVRMALGLSNDGDVTDSGLKA